MVQRSGRGKRAKHPSMGNHQRCWIWGRHLVLETLRARVWQPLEIILADDLPADARQECLDLLAGRSHPVEIQVLSRETLTKRAGTEHQGYLARMPPFPYSRLTDVLNPPRKIDAAPLVLILDSIQDPHNFGTILRSAEVLGVHGVAVGETHQAEVSSHVARSSAGAINRIPLVRGDLLSLAADLKSAGVRLAAASEKAERLASETDLTGPLALVIGNEGRGIHPELLACCDLSVRIPVCGQIGSLNAAAAAAILCYEARRQRG